MSNSSGGAGEAVASASRSIELQKGQATPTTLAPVAINSWARTALTRLPFSSPRKNCPPPAPQQKLRPRARGGSIAEPMTPRGSS